jgi:hypothetical protein
MKESRREKHAGEPLSLVDAPCKREILQQAP